MGSPLRNHLAASIVVAVSAVSLQVAGAGTDPPEPPRTEAAEAVGEGNAARCLDYYRRERGQTWTQPTNEGAQKPNSPEGEPNAPHPAPPPRNQ
jgi:hypothetical protein